MELNELIEEAKKRNGLSQNKLSVRIGLGPSQMSQILHRKRRMPAEAAIELAELTGEPAKRVWEAAKAYAARAAVVVLTSGTLFFSGAEKAVATQSITNGNAVVIQIIT